MGFFQQSDELAGDLAVALAVLAFDYLAARLVARPLPYLAIPWLVKRYKYFTLILFSFMLDTVRLTLNRLDR